MLHHHNRFLATVSLLRLRSGLSDIHHHYVFRNYPIVRDLSSQLAYTVSPDDRTDS